MKDYMTKINLVNYEEGRYNGILSKFAYKMKDELVKLGYEVKVSPAPDNSYDVNHHINYLPYKHENSPDTINTLMVTHIWEGYKLDALKEGLKTAHGVCMSQDTVDDLVKWGMKKKDLSIILPAHHGKSRRHQIVAILTNVYPDGCKRQEMFEALTKTLDHTQWAFRIMGKDWTNILRPLVEKGVNIQYFDEFNYDIHNQILDSSDYCLYFGKDEGSMAILDAKNAGLKVIAPNIGFHKEIGIDYPFDTQKELNAIFKSLNPNPVKDWTWETYVKQHIKLWQKLK